MVNEVALNFLGTSFKITTDAEEEYLEKVLSQYSAAISQTQSISGISEPLNVAVLTGFMLCDEINKLKQKLGITADSPEDASSENISNEAASDEAMEIALRTRRLAVLLDQVIDKYDNG